MDVWTDLLLLILLALLVGLRLAVRGNGEGEALAPDSPRLRWPANWLSEAGYLGSNYLISFASAKLMFAVLGAWLAAWVMDLSRPGGWLLMLYLALLFSFVPEMWLYRKRKARKEKVASGLSYFLDLLVSFLRSGLSLEKAFFRAGREAFIGEHPIAAEVERLENEVQAGRDRAHAFELLADRTGVDDLRMVAAALRISTRQGGEIAETLSLQADLLRVKRREKAMRKVSTQTAVAVIPVFLCGIPIFMVVVYFPAVLQVMEVIKNLRLL